MRLSVYLYVCICIFVLIYVYICLRERSVCCCVRQQLKHTRTNILFCIFMKETCKNSVLNSIFNDISQNRV